MSKQLTRLQRLDQSVMEADRRFGTLWPEGLAHHLASLHKTSTRLVIDRRRMLRCSI